MAFNGGTWRLYLKSCIESLPLEQRQHFLIENQIAVERAIKAHVTLLEIHLNFEKLFRSFDREFRKAHPDGARKAFRETLEYRNFEDTFTQFLYTKAFPLLQGVELRDPCRDGERKDDQNYSLKGQSGKNPFFAKDFNVRDPTDSDKPYITQFRIAVYKFLNRYFGIEGGDYKTSDGTYQLYRKGGVSYYATPLHSWGVGKWVPHMSVAQINVDGWDKSDLQGNADLLSVLLKSCRKIRNRAPWEHITLGGDNTSFSFSLK